VCVCVCECDDVCVFGFSYFSTWSNKLKEIEK